MVKIEKKDAVVYLFEETKFPEYSIYFYQEKRTKYEVAKNLCKEEVNLQTINNHFQKFKDDDGYYDDELVQSFPKGRQLPQRLTNRVPAFWFMFRANLSGEEGDLLFKFFETPTIENILRKSESWEEFSKVVVVSMIFISIFKDIEMEFENPMNFFRFANLNEMDIFKRVSEEEVGDFSKALDDWSNKGEKKADNLIKKVVDSDIPILTNAHEWESLIRSVIYSSGEIPLNIAKFIKDHPRLKKGTKKMILKGLGQAMKQGIPEENFSSFLEEKGSD